MLSCRIGLRLYSLTPGRIRETHTTPRVTTFFCISSTSSKVNAKCSSPTGQISFHTQTLPPPFLSSTGFVYVRIDGHRNPLQRPYNALFQIISTSDKYFTLDINGRPDNVFVNKLKPVYVGTSDQTEPPFLTNIAPEATTPIQQATTRSGRTTRPPGYLKNFCTAQHSN